MVSGDLVRRALDTAQASGASYVEARFVDRATQAVAVKDGHVQNVDRQESAGIGIRVIVDGAWGFAGTAALDGPGIDLCAGEAVRIARASGRLRGAPVDLGEPVRTRGSYRTPIVRDPLAVPLEEQLSLLLEADAAMRRVQGLKSTQGNIVAQRERKVFANGEGAFVEQELYETGCGIFAVAADGQEVQNRSYPNSLGRHQACEGYEFVERYDLVGHAERTAEEAVALLSAKQCPPGVTTVILDSSQLALQIHESCGHPIELDRVFGTELDFAGGSFLSVDKLDTFRYGSDLVNIYADATILGGLGTFGFDDEGVQAQRLPIVERGMFRGYLTSRETAQRLGRASGGCARADGWGAIPLIRMTNVGIEPGTWELDDLIADTDEGIYMLTNRSWSIDDQRLNFQFGTEMAYEIRNGKRGAMLKNATYTGITPQFWGSCDAICNRRHYTVWGTPNCGKGQPMQAAHTGHGAAPARFRTIQVGVMR